MLFFPCQIKHKSLLKVCSPQLSTWSVSTLRIRTERASPWWRQLSPVCISLCGNKTQVIYWCLNLPCSITSPVKPSGRCLVPRRIWGGLPCDKYHAPKLQMLAKMQSFSPRRWQNAVFHPTKCCASNFLSLKPRSVFGLCLQPISGKKWAKISFMELVGKGDYC